MSEFLMVSKNLEIRELSTGIEISEHGNNAVDKDLKIPNESSKRRVARSGVVPGDSKFICQDCDSIFNSKQALWYHTKFKA